MEKKEIGTFTVPASFTWNDLDQKQANEILLSLGQDPTPDKFFDDLGRCVKQLRGVTVNFSAAVTAFTSVPDKFASYSKADALQICHDALKAAAERATADIRRKLIEATIAGGRFNRQIDFGVVPITCELA